MKTMNHAEYQERLRGLPSQSLRFIAVDAQEAINAMPDGPNAGYYADEISYCAMELRRRVRSELGWSCVKDQVATLNRVYRMLRKAGYGHGGDVIDGLRDLIDDSKRPATEDAESEPVVVIPLSLAQAAGRNLSESDYRGCETDVRFNDIVREQS